MSATALATGILNVQPALAVQGLTAGRIPGNFPHRLSQKNLCHYLADTAVLSESAFRRRSQQS